MGSDGGNIEFDVGIPPSDGPEDGRDVRSASQGGGMGVVIGVGGIGRGEAMAYKGRHLLATGYH